ncbi:MAG: hypothetical protein GY943_03850 [Chloroflexi bacterium]|nr:hypothetical protein [Chloroflexota bacterium]
MKFRDQVTGNGLYQLSQLTQKTGRYQVTGLDNLETAVSSNRPIVFAAWHGMTMMLAGFFATQFDLSQLVLILPDDWRGQTLTVFATKLGVQPFPMDLTGEGGMAAARKLAKLVRLVKKGLHCYITPDGPEGPAYVIKPGAAFIARKANAHILPVGAYARNAYQLNRWDQYTIPYPYSRISIHVGKPIDVPKEKELTAVADSFTDTLHQVTAQAAANYYENEHTN